MRDHQHAALPGRGEHAVHELVGQPGVEPAGRLVEDHDRARGEQGAGDGQPPPLAARERDPVLADRGVEPVGQRAPPSASSRAARSAAAISSSPASGRASVRLERRVPGEQLGPLVGQRAGGSGRRRWERRSTSVPPSDERARLEGPEAQEGGDEARLAGAARAGDGDPAAGGHPHGDAVEGAGQARSVAEGGVLEGHLGHAGRRRRRERRGRARGRAPSSSAKSRSAEARTARARATASGTPGTGLEGGQHGEREHRHHDLAEVVRVDRARPRGRARRSPPRRGRAR